MLYQCSEVEGYVVPKFVIFEDQLKVDFFARFSKFSSLDVELPQRLLPEKELRNQKHIMDKVDHEDIEHM